jgi:hypothetical protein
VTPRERIRAAHSEFASWCAPSELEWWQRDLMASDRRGTALARLVGTLTSLASHGDVSPEDVAEAVEESLRVADVDLIFGRTSEPQPLPVDEPRRVRGAVGVG